MRSELSRTSSGSAAHAAPRRLRTAVALIVVLLVAAVGTAFADSGSLYYREEAKDGRIYVFNTPERHRLWQQTGEMGKSITLIGHGPAGETVVAENEAALHLYNFKHDTPAYEPAEAPAPPAPAAPVKLPQVKIGALWYLSYQDGKAAGADYSKFLIKRGYINIEAKVLPFLSARITPDVHQDSTGDLKVRLKYAYAKFTAPDFAFVTDPAAEVGVAHTPWLDFEEHINNYRMQDTMFMERNGLFNSADAGVTFMGLLGGYVSEDYQHEVSHAYPGRWGSFAFGVYNGGGYHAAENNQNKVFEGRLTIRPLPDLLPGLQASYFAVRGKGNTEAEPDWNVDTFMLSFEHRYLVFTGQLVDASGNQKGSAVDAAGRALGQDGWSVFAEGKLTPTWSIIGRYDDYDPNDAIADARQKRTIAGVAYHLGKGNTVLLDWDSVDYGGTSRTDDRVQLTLQVKY